MLSSKVNVHYYYHCGCAIWAAMIVAFIAAQIAQSQQVLLTNVSRRPLSFWLFQYSQIFSVILAILFGKLAKSAAIAAATLYIPLEGWVPCHAMQWPTPPSHLYSVEYVCHTTLSGLWTIHWYKLWESGISQNSNQIGTKWNSQGSNYTVNLIQHTMYTMSKRKSEDKQLRTASKLGELNIYDP